LVFRSRIAIELVHCKFYEMVKVRLGQGTLGTRHMFRISEARSLKLPWKIRKKVEILNENIVFGIENEYCLKL
jgi:hypothetical protein